MIKVFESIFVCILKLPVGIEDGDGCSSWVLTAIKRKETVRKK